MALIRRILMALVAAFRTFVAGLDEGLDSPQAPTPRGVTKELREIMENHLAYIYGRLGRLEGKMTIVLFVLGTVAATLLGSIITQVMTHFLQ